MDMPKLNRIFAISLISLIALPLPTAKSAEPYQVTVMSRNLYLGADVGVALELIPNFPAAIS